MCLGNAGLATRVLTRLLVGVPAARLPESHQGSEVGSQHGPAEGGHRVDAHQAADEGVLAALEQGHDVGPHVVSVLLSEVLREKEGAGPKGYSTGGGRNNDDTISICRFVYDVQKKYSSAAKMAVKKFWQQQEQQVQ